MALLDAFSMVRDHLQKAEHCNSLLIRAVEDLPISGMFYSFQIIIVGFHPRDSYKLRIFIFLLVVSL